MTRHWLTVGALAAAMVPAQALAESVGYDDAIECGALYSFLASSLEGQPGEEILVDLAARWVVLAMVRDGTDDGSRAQDELKPHLGLLIDELDALGEDQQMVEQVLFDRVAYCEAIQEQVSEEFDSADQ